MLILANATSMPPTTASWLPDTPVTADQTRLLICRYQGSSLLTDWRVRDGVVRTTDGTWSCERRGGPHGFQVTFRLVMGAAKSYGVAVAFDIARWSTRDSLMIPGAVYDGNRFHALGGGYMPPYPRSMFFNPALPLTISNDPRLAIEAGKPSSIELLTGNASTPAFAIYSPSTKEGTILLCDQRTRFGNNALIVAENAAHDRLTLVVSAPGVRAKAAEFGGFRPSGDEGADWKPGDALTLNFRTYTFHASGIPDLLNTFFHVRKALTSPNHPRNLVPMSKMAETIGARCKKRWQVAPVGGFYLPENSPDFQLGWVSGFMQTPMLAMGDPLERQHVLAQMDFVVQRLQGSSGLFYGGITANGKIRADRSLDDRNFVLTRKDGDTLLMFFKFFEILKAQGYADLIKPEWERAAKRLAQAFVRIWKSRGEFGQYLDPDTGAIAVYNSTCGAIVPAGLAHASLYFHDPEFLDVAKASAEFYYHRDVLQHGSTFGNCGDISQDPDSESAFGFLQSLMALYWATHDSSWLQRAETVAALGSTWTLSYDYAFPPQSDIGKLGGHMAGAVFASAQNKHAAPGICLSSGDDLFKLFRATGDVRYAELLRDIQHAHVEATDMPGHRTCLAGDGASMERIQPTDAEGTGAVGNFIQTQNAWCELDGLMMALEIPGIYARTDIDRCFVFDHVTAAVIKRGRNGVTLKITNPTAYDATVAVFVEGAGRAATPLSSTAYLRWPKVNVRAGQTVIARVGEMKGGTESIGPSRSP